MSNSKIPYGYILLSRKLIESEIMKKPPLYLKVWVWLLLKAQHAEYNNLGRGHGKTSIPEIQEAMSYKVGYRIEKPSKKEIFGILEWLRNPYEGNTEGNNGGNNKIPMMVTTKVTHGILYNIVKYDFYQNPENYEGNNGCNGKDSTKVTTKVLRRLRQGNNKYKNVKNDKNINNNNKNIFVENSIEFQLSHKLLSFILKNNPNAKQPNIQSWCADFDKMIRIDNRAPDDIETVIEFSQKDTFWQCNILSPKKLREKFDTLWMQNSTRGGATNEGHKQHPPVLQKSTPQLGPDDELFPEGYEPDTTQYDF